MSAIEGGRISPSGLVATEDAPQPRIERAWAVLDGVLDPEVPVISVRELGIARDVLAEGDRLVVVLTPTYSGCPATEVIAQRVTEALDAAGLHPVTVRMQLAPAWTSDWITAAGRDKLLAFGIVPPGPAASAASASSAGSESSHAASSTSTGGAAAEVAPLRFMPRRAAPRLACPRCGSAETERIAAFGSTACKSLYRCHACGEPFEHFKAI